MVNPLGNSGRLHHGRADSATGSDGEAAAGAAAGSASAAGTAAGSASAAGAAAGSASAAGSAAEQRAGALNGARMAQNPSASTSRGAVKALRQEMRTAGNKRQRDASPVFRQAHAQLNVPDD